MCESGLSQVFVFGGWRRVEDSIAWTAFERSSGVVKRDFDLFAPLYVSMY